MKNHFVSHIKTDFDGENNQNILFEMMAICISDGTRIIIEQNATHGEKYLMVDFMTTDNSNPGGYEYDGLHVCQITSVDGEDEGGVYEQFTNYLDACRWLADFTRQGDFHEIYIETY